MKVTAHRRVREVRPAPGAEKAAREALREIARAEVKAARALATIERSRSHVRSGCASVQAWAAEAGYGPVHTNRLLALGRTLFRAPELTAPVRAGQVPAESAVTVGRVLLEPTLKLDAEQRAAWIEKARTVPPRELRKEADKAVEEARRGAPTFHLRLLVTREARDGFRRARILMSRGKLRWVTEGEAFGRLVEDWRSRNDPCVRPLPARRAAPTGGRRSRYISRRVFAQVERRSGGLCEVCGVRRATEKIHIKTPHALGGSREADNLADGCPECHVMVDAGVFVFAHFDAQGHPKWRFDPVPVGGAAPVGGERPTCVRERSPPYASAG